MLVSVLLLHIATTVHLVINGNLSRLLLLLLMLIGGGKRGRKVVANGAGSSRLLLFHLLADETCVIGSQRLGVIIALGLATAKAGRLLILLLKTVEILMSFQ